jgi:hypothetical protein
MDLEETGWSDMDWFHPAQDMEQWLAPVNTEMNFRLP